MRIRRKKMRIVKDDLKKIIIEGNTRILVERSQDFGSDLAKDLKRKDQRGRDRVEISKLTTSQIRNFFGTVKKIEAKGFDNAGEREFLLLKPKLAYAAKKAGKTKLNDLKDVLTDSIDLVTSEEGNKQEKFNRFCDLFESILCYHKASGGN
jgi:CRISPR-associated protein Csm2